MARDLRDEVAGLLRRDSIARKKFLRESLRELSDERVRQLRDLLRPPDGGSELPGGT